MKEIITTINSKGQLTIPVEILKYLGLDIGDKIAFVIDSEGMVQVKVPLSGRQMKQIAYEDRLQEKYMRE